jgi:ubiquinone/menaquinone biosynthesis C-methylase UbiE
METGFSCRRDRGKLAVMWRNLPVAGLLTIAALHAQQPTPGQQPTEEALKKLAAHVDKALGLRPGITVADIGTGAAVHQPIRIAGEVAPDGKVICVEVSQSYVDKIKARIHDEHISNMEVVLGKEDDPTLAPGAFDAVLISNTYHEFTQPEAMLKHIREALKPDGCLVVVENYTLVQKSVSRAEQVKRHEMEPEILERELTAAGLTVKERVDPILVNGTDRFRYLVRAEKTK